MPHAVGSAPLTLPSAQALGTAIAPDERASNETGGPRDGKDEQERELVVAGGVVLEADVWRRDDQDCERHGQEQPESEGPGPKRSRSRIHAPTDRLRSVSDVADWTEISD